jgi:hypothetical protein
VETVYREARARWLREEAPRRSVREHIADSVPYWIIVVALVLFGLSAPHTAEVFDKLTPGWGWIAPIGVEFGLLYAAFQRRLAKAEQRPLPWTLWALEILLFVTAVLVNGAGAFTSVVAVSGLESLPFAAIKDEFEHFPATTQAALVMAVLSAFIIPIGALVAGEGLAALALERDTARTDGREQGWQEAAFTETYRAVFVRYLASGLDEHAAQQRASAEVKAYLGRSRTRTSRIRPPSAGRGQNGQPGRNGQSGQPNGRRTNGRYGQVKDAVRAHLDAHPELEPLSVNQVLAHLQDAGIQAGRTSVAEVLQERKLE